MNYYSESFKLAKSEDLGCPIAFMTSLSDGIFHIRPCTSDYDKTQGYHYIIGLSKNVSLTNETAPYIPNAKCISSYMHQRGITVQPNLWGVGYQHKMYVPFPAGYNLQKIVNVSDIRQVTTKQQGLKDVVDIYAVCGVPNSGEIKMTFWGEHAVKIKELMR